MAEEKGTHNVEISDSEKKLDALADMIRDACGRMDAVGSRMDAMEENFRRSDARMDALSRKDEDEKEEKKEEREDRKDSEEKEEREEKDARRDSEEKEVKEKGEPKEPAADRGRKDSEEEKGDKREDRKDARRDSEEEEKKEEREEKDRKDSRKDEDEGMEADNAPISRAEAAALRSEIARLQARTPAILADGDRERFARIQEQADAAFQAFGDRAPAPLDGETPTQYKRRLGTKMQSHSEKWKDTRLSAIADDTTLDVIVGEVFADSISAARRGVAVPAGQLREITRHSGGHTIIEFEGAADSWMNDFSGVSMRATGTWHRPH